MAHKKDDPKLIAFAKLLPGQLTQVDKTLIQTMVSVSDLGRWTEAAGEAPCAMALHGELQIEGVDFTLSGVPCKGHSTQASQSQRSPLVVDLSKSTLKALKH